MSLETPPQGRGQRGLSRQLSRVGHGLLVLFGCTLISPALPPQLLAPAWQLQMSAALINNGSIALVGVLLISLAAWLQPEERGLQRRQAQLRRLALLAVIGYLLLVPLQAAALWRGLQQGSRNLEDRRRQASSRLESLGRLVREARSSRELREGLRRIPGAPAIPEERFNEPLPILRERFETALARARGRIEGTGSQPDGTMLQRLLKESLRTSLSALALAFCFADCSRGSSPARTLLDDLPDRFARPLRLRWPASRRRRRGSP